ncbi:MAG: AlwI family type II restriction endonuclease [Clostridiales bacterium]|nr:AlwI family type II restriction endonuclease [Clostridiales bacterium]
MRFDENEAISIWLVGNTGLRNPMRIQEGFRAFAGSPFVGNLHGREQELGFMRFLNDNGVIRNEAGRDVSGSHARKWRLMFAKNGFIYGQASRENGFRQEELGELDSITPFGRVFLTADTIPAMQECFLRSLTVEQFWLPDHAGHFSPFRWILAIMLELERRTGTSELSRIEFGLYGHTTNPSYDLNEVVDRIIDLRERRAAAPSKRVFDRNEIAERGEHYDKKKENFLDYSDMNMRYLRISGVLQRKGRGLIIAPTKHVIAESLAKATASTGPMLDEFKILTEGAPLPTDNLKVATAVLDELQNVLRERHILFDITDLPLTTAAEVNVARRRLERLLSETDEILYAEDQRNRWQEISDYMTLLINGGGTRRYNEDYVIEVPRDEMPAYLEWVLWRAILAIDHLQNQPYEIRGFRLDSDFLPVSAAGGGRGDLYCEFNDYTILTEVTMSTSTRQEAMEGEPVRRHVADAVEAYDKPVYGMFIAVRIDTNTAETFRHGVWYKRGDEQQRLNIVPFTLAQFQQYFDFMFTSGDATPDRLVELIDNCARKRDIMEAPAWKNYIDGTIRDRIQGDTFETGFAVAEPQMIYTVNDNMSFPYGIYFGSKVRNTETGEIGCVVGFQENSVLVAFEGDNAEPRIVMTNSELFENGSYSLA